MSYCYAASDKKIKTIYEAIKNDYYDGTFPNRKPDMALFYSSPEGQVSDAIMIEFKAIGAKRQEKRQAPAEIMEYAGIIRENLPEVRSIWNYIITEIDDEFANSLTKNDFNEQFSNSSEGRIFHRFFTNSQVNTYVISTKAIVADASIRNSVFLDIIKNRAEI
jgi:hypothetical protein